MKSHWEERHTLLADSAYPEALPLAPESRCYSVGVCLCSAEGKLLAARVEELLRAMKRLCPIGSRMRDRLRDGYLVANVMGCPQVDDGDGIDDALLDESAFPAEWWHFGLQSWSPYRPTILRAKQASDPCELPPDANRVYIESLGECDTVHTAMSRFASSASVSLRWYHLEESDRPIALLTPQRVPVVANAFVPEQQLWPPPRPPRKPRPPKPRPDEDAWGDDADGSSDEAREEEKLDEEGREESGGELEDACAALMAAYDKGGGLAEEAPLVPLAPSSPSDSQALATVGASSSSAGALPVFPLAAPIAKAHAKAACIVANRFVGPRTNALAVVNLGGGKISAYRSGWFEAVCNHPGHGGGCRLTRRGVGASRLTPTQSGMPLGLMAAWLAVGPLCEDRTEHWQPEVFDITLEVREVCRRELETLEGAAELLACEQRVDGDPAEPLISM